MILGAVGLVVLIVAGFFAIGRGLRAGEPVGMDGSSTGSALPPADAPQHEGSLPGWPIRVDSAARIEPRAARERCARCGAEVRVAAHEARQVAGRRLRMVHLQCRRCAAEQALWFALPEAIPEA